MVRSLLIALLTVVAVAGPATATVPPLLELADPEPATTVDGALSPEAWKAPCSFEPCPFVHGNCYPYEATLDQTKWPPEFSFSIDPDGCIRDFIDGAIDWPPRPVASLWKLVDRAFSSEQPATPPEGDPPESPETPE